MTDDDRIEVDGLSAVADHQKLVGGTTFLERLDEAMVRAEVVADDDESGDPNAYDERMALEANIAMAEEYARELGVVERDLLPKDCLTMGQYAARSVIYRLLLSGDPSQLDDLAIVVEEVLGQPWSLGEILDETVWVYGADALARSKWPSKAWRKVWLAFRRLVRKHGDIASQDRVRQLEREVRKFGGCVLGRG